MTVTLDDVVGETAEEPEELSNPPAGWWQRVGAFCIDVVFGVGAVLSLLLVGWSAPQGGWVWWLCRVLAAALLVAVGVNRLLAPAITGWTLGRSIVGIAVIDRHGQRPGPWRLLGRDGAHLLDTLPLFLGWLWPLIDDRGRTFADMLARTEVIRVDGPRPDLRRLAGGAIALTAGLAVFGAALGYLGVYRPQEVIAEARSQIAKAGPKIVVDLLSYSKDDVETAFADAQLLVTDAYRPELIEQQAAVREAGPVDNDYWASNSAVLSASRDRAAMLMLLQGQRGAADQQRFITASVRVDFEKIGTEWKVSNLTVLAPPKPKAAIAGPADPADTADPTESGDRDTTPTPASPEPASPAPAPAPAAPTPSAGRR